MAGDQHHHHDHHDHECGHDHEHHARTEHAITAPLLGEYDHGTRKNWHPDAFLWRFVHALGFFIGGTTFIAGTVVLFFPGWDFTSAALYTLGSLGFLTVDVMEVFTFSGAVLRTNISMSMTGSFLYVVGSVGFFPSVVAFNPLIGIWGFVLGSAYIGWSQLWKVHRIGGGELDGFRLSNLVADKDTFTATGVELGAGIGAWCFFVGTLLYQNGPLEGAASVLSTVLWTWTIGSCWFTLGSLFLIWRHFVMGVV